MKVMNQLKVAGFSPVAVTMYRRGVEPQHEFSGVLKRVRNRAADNGENGNPGCGCRQKPLAEQADHVIDKLNAQLNGGKPSECLPSRSAELLSNPELSLNDFNDLLNAVDKHPARFSDPIFLDVINRMSEAIKLAEDKKDNKIAELLNGRSKVLQNHLSALIQAQDKAETACTDPKSRP
jgi:hypothetical protein